MSFGGDNTPITSDEDEDIDEAQQNGMTGNFTETVHDDYSGHHNTGGDDPYHNHDHYSNHNQAIDQDEHLWVEISYDLETKRFYFEPNDTLSSLRLRVNDEPNFEMSDCHRFCLAREVNEDDNEYYEDPSEMDLLREGRLLDDERKRAALYHGRTLSIYWRSFVLTIIDGLDTEIREKVAQNWTIRKVKEQVELKHGIRLQCLSHRGEEVTDDITLQHYGIDKDGFTLVSRISISLEDHDCQISTDLRICDFWDWEKILSTYLEVERREYHSSGHLIFEGQRVCYTLDFVV